MVKTIIFFICSLLTISLYSDEARELFLQANQRYANQDYVNAAELYEKIEPRTAAVWYNLGNSYYQLDKKLDAYIAWSNALQSDDNKIVKSATIHRDKVAQELGINDQAENLITISRLSNRLWMQLFMIILFIILSYFIRNSRHLLVQTLLFLMLASLLYVSYRMGENKKMRSKAIASHEQPLYNGPGERYQTIASVPAYSPLRVIDTKDDWKHVQGATINGWVPSKSIMIYY